MITKYFTWKCMEFIFFKLETYNGGYVWTVKWRQLVLTWSNSNIIDLHFESVSSQSYQLNRGKIEFFNKYFRRIYDTFTRCIMTNKQLPRLVWRHGEKSVVKRNDRLNVNQSATCDSVVKRERTNNVIRNELSLPPFLALDMNCAAFLAETAK